MSRTIASPIPTSAAAIVEHEQREDLADVAVVEGAERHEVDVHAGQHQLDAHQDEHGVLPCEDTVDARTEQERGEDEELVEQHP